MLQQLESKVRDMLHDSDEKSSVGISKRGFALASNLTTVTASTDNQLSLGTIVCLCDVKSFFHETIFHFSVYLTVSVSNRSEHCNLVIFTCHALFGTISTSDY